MTSTASDPAVSVLVLPHRSLSRAGLIAFLAAQTIATAVFATMAAMAGNVFAPGFAVLAIGFVALCLTRIWRKSSTGQIVTLTPTRLDVSTTSGAQTAQFHPYWVRVRVEQGRHRGWPGKLLIGSHGREIEIGAFLKDEERREVAQRISDLLREMQTRAGPSN